MKVISNIKRAFRYLNLNIMLYRAVRNADKMANQTGRTYFVVCGPEGTLISLTRSHYKKLVTKGKARYVNANQMYQGCFYCTNWFGKPVPREVIERKRRMFFAAFLN